MAAIVITETNFEQEVKNSDKTVIVDFWASWCGPCKMFSPIIESFAEEHAGTIKVCKVNIDDAQDLASKFNVMSVPTVMVFKGGEVVATRIGMQSKQELEKLVE